MAEGSIGGNDRRILLVGKTGSGKSSSGNVILSMEESNKDILQYFKTGFAEQVHTYYNESYTRTILARNVTVTDTPGLNSQADQPERIASEVRQAIEQSKDGYHAIVYVLNVFKDDLTLNDEEIETFNEVKSLMGDKFMDFVVLLFTHGDSYEEKLKPSKQMASMLHYPKLTFEEVISRDRLSTNKYAIGSYVRSVKNRAVLFENSEPDPEKRKDMVQKLLSKVDEICSEQDGVSFVKDMLPDELPPVLQPEQIPIAIPKPTPFYFQKGSILLFTLSVLLLAICYNNNWLHLGVEKLFEIFSSNSTKSGTDNIPTVTPQPDDKPANK